MATHNIPRNMTEETYKALIQQRPKELLSSNGKLGKDGIFSLTLPAKHGKVVIGGKLQDYTTCPSAGACKAICYSDGGAYLFPGSLIKHNRNLQFMLSDPFEFVDQLVKEIQSKLKHVKHFRAVRFMDSGDISSDMHWSVMKHVMERLPNVQFYAYTKNVSFIKAKQASGEIPKNFTYVFSFGGLEDHLIDTKKDRHAQVFSTRKALRASGYSDGSNTDRLAANPKYMKIAFCVHGNWLKMPKMRKMVEKACFHPKPEITA